MTTAPDKIGPYEVLERISAGGMAEVYKAKLTGADSFERLVAIKRILPHIARDPNFIAMFQAEAKLAVQLQHGNIAQIYQLGRQDDAFYIALEYVEGRDVGALLDLHQKAGKSLPLAQACYIITRCAEGLDYAHNKKSDDGKPLNIIHRDISPPNILISYEGEVKLIDFGLAKATSSSVQTQAGVIKGKLAYMSPEQVRGAPLDARSDVFALGIVFFELLTGRRLFRRDSDIETFESVRQCKVPRPSEVNPAIPAPLEHILLRSLARSLDDRYPSAAALAEALREFVFTHQLRYRGDQLGAWMRQIFRKN
ncbi:Serine/threonine protein kinase [Nannocystis exedens]|uniref:Serine/threonine protein kinase n=1 Tax=Nannocystis exedens TaxID=54 RepID=A0A1I2GEB4_9BACT|nr:serine/threonine-protein kinase [Nannocystis exedens]PCC69989.1 Tyrosine-protein kinase MasK [Nannocystis exedens]SFF15935.1 Serine/threonine protein kinase [Nannocystis exedens]